MTSTDNNPGGSTMTNATHPLLKRVQKAQAYLDTLIALQASARDNYEALKEDLRQRHVANNYQLSRAKGELAGATRRVNEQREAVEARQAAYDRRHEPAQKAFGGYWLTPDAPEALLDGIMLGRIRALHKVQDDYDSDRMGEHLEEVRLLLRDLNIEPDHGLETRMISVARRMARDAEGLAEMYKQFIGPAITTKPTR